MDELEYARKHVIYVQEGVGIKPGSFTHFLIKAFFAADRINFHRLKNTWPAIGQAVEEYLNGELTDD